MSHVDDGALHAYLDGELSAVERSRVEGHLADCLACRERLEEERALIARAGELLALAAPPARDLPPFEDIRRPARLWWQVRMPLAWAATVVLALATGWFLGGERVREAPVNVNVAAKPYPRPAAVPSRGLVREADRLADAAPAVRRAAGPAKAAATPTPAAVAADAGLDVTAAWPPIPSADAPAILGAEPATIPGLPVRQVRRSLLGDGGILVEQQLDTATVIQLFEWRAVDGTQRMPAEGRARREARSERLARYVGSLRVEIAGPLPVDSLSRLLEMVR